MAKRNQGWVTFAIVTIISLVILAWSLGNIKSAHQTTPLSQKNSQTNETAENKIPVKLVTAYVLSVVDGDTIKAEVNGKPEKVRFIGVDTPETKHPSKPVETYGREASKYTTTQLMGQKIYLETDLAERDKYGRLLAYVWLAAPKEINDNEIRTKQFNSHLLLNGYAQLMTIQPNVKYVDYFVKYQREARETNQGLWGANPSMGNNEVILFITRTGVKYHRSECEYLAKSKIPIKYSDAITEGYEPCSKCNPPN